MMIARLLMLTSVLILPLGAHALAPTDAESSVPPDESVVSDAKAVEGPDAATTIEVRNNSAFTIYVVQKGIKKEVASKKTLIVYDFVIDQVTITPKSDQSIIPSPSFKFVMMTGKTGPCLYVSCLFVQ